MGRAKASILGSNPATHILMKICWLCTYQSYTSPRHLPPTNPEFCGILLRNELDEFIHTKVGWGVYFSSGISKVFCKGPDSKYLRLWGPYNDQTNKHGHVPINLCWWALKFEFHNIFISHKIPPLWAFFGKFFNCCSDLGSEARLSRVESTRWEGSREDFRKNVTFDLNLEGHEGIKLTEVEESQGWPNGQCEQKYGGRESLWKLNVFCACVVSLLFASPCAFSTLR